MGQPGVREGKAHRRQVMPTGLLAGAQKAKNWGADLNASSCSSWPLFSWPLFSFSPASCFLPFGQDLERFSSEVDTGSRQENASKQKSRARF
jgi:hypothetical protein